MIYYRHFGKALKKEMFDSIIGELMSEAFSKGGSKVESHDYYKYRISYITQNELNLIFLFVTGLTDNFDNIKKELLKCKKEFLNLFEDILTHKYDSKTFEVFDPTVDSIHRNLRPKISLVGFSGVGKTTITRLIKAEEIPMQHIPTITGDIATIKIGKLYFHLWDFAGQEQFSYLWNNFIKGSDAVLLITDSSLENVEKSKFFLELIKEQAGDAHTAVIGNKQDLPDAMKPEQIEKILGLKTYSMIAKEVANRDKMIQIIADVLEMSAEISPLLKPLLERDTLIEKATRCLEKAEFAEAANLFEKISDLCIELGDDSLGREFFEKSKKIKSMLKKLTQKADIKTKPVEESQAKGKEEASKAKPPEPPKEIKKPTMPPPPPPLPSQETKKPTLPPSPPPPPITTRKAEETTETSPKADIKPPSPVKKPPPPDVGSTAPAEPKRFAGLEATMDEEKIEGIKKVRVPKQVKPKLPQEPSKEEQETIMKPEVTADQAGLSLNPDDFIIKQRPKKITAVPKDAKNKLKTSPFAAVTNPPEKTPPKPISPVKLIQDKPRDDVPRPPPSPQEQPASIEVKPPEPTKLPKVTTVPIQKQPETTPSPSPKTEGEAKSPESITTETQAKPVVDTGISEQQKSDLEKNLMDLKIKKANLSKLALDYDMKELTGEITADELQEKKDKLDKIVEGVNTQIKELEDMLK